MGDFNEVLTSEERLDKGTYDDTGPSKGCNKWCWKLPDVNWMRDGLLMQNRVGWVTFY